MEMLRNNPNVDSRFKYKGGLFDFAWRFLLQETPGLQIDHAFAKHAFAFSAQQVLLNEAGLVRSLRATMLGMYIMDVAIPESQGDEAGSHEWVRRVDKIMVPRGLIPRIAKRVPCHCLDALADEAKAMERVRCCNECSEVFPSDELMACSRCKKFRYCSVECQRKNW